jgi:hypothetical protein
MSHSWGQQPIAGTFQHQSHAGTELAQCLQVSSTHQTWICMRQQARLIQYPFAHLHQIRESGSVSEPC